MKRPIFWALLVYVILSLLLGFIVWLATAPQPVAADCETVPVTGNTPTGIAGCMVLGDGVASHYGFGDGVAMNFCTWTVRHESGCGLVTIQSHQTGVTVTVPVVDFCDCYTGTADERIVDLQYGVVAALGLDLSQGLYPVTVWREGASSSAGAGGDGEAQPPVVAPVLPNTAMEVQP